MTSEPTLINFRQLSNFAMRVSTDHGIKNYMWKRKIWNIEHKTADQHYITKGEEQKIVCRFLHAYEIVCVIFYCLIWYQTRMILKVTVSRTSTSYSYPLVYLIKWERRRIDSTFIFPRHRYSKTPQQLWRMSKVSQEVLLWRHHVNHSINVLLGSLIKGIKFSVSKFPAPEW